MTETLRISKIQDTIYPGKLRDGDKETIEKARFEGLIYFEGDIHVTDSDRKIRIHTIRDTERLDNPKPSSDPFPHPTHSYMQAKYAWNDGEIDYVQFLRSLGISKAFYDLIGCARKENDNYKIDEKMVDLFTHLVNSFYQWKNPQIGEKYTWITPYPWVEREHVIKLTKELRQDG